MPADCPPKATCPPPKQDPCPQVCAPPPPAPLCRVKPVMRGLHWSRTKRCLTQALIASALVGATVYLTYTKPRRERYREFYEHAELADWADDMARKGLFQSVPRKNKE